VSFCVSEQDEESDSSVDSPSDGELNKLIQDASKRMRSAGEGGASYVSVEKVRDVDDDDDGDYNYRVSESVGEGRGRGSEHNHPLQPTSLPVIRDSSTFFGQAVLRSGWCRFQV
jgi:hypothetical protein